MNGKRPRFEKLCQAARQEQPPPIDVVDKVIDSVAARSAPQWTESKCDWVLWSVSGLSAVAAAIVLLLSLQQDILFSDPLALWLRPIVVVLQ